MLVELAIGDAYGAGFEFVSSSMVKLENTCSSYVEHPKHLDLKLGSYTDDTQMSIALSELMLSGMKIWTKKSISDVFFEVYKRDPRVGYSKRLNRFFEEGKEKDTFFKLVSGGSHSDTSGASMRAGVIGLYRDINEVKDKSRLQATVTHNTRFGMESAIVSSLIVHYFRYAWGPKANLIEYLLYETGYDWIRPWTGKVESKGVEVVCAAITAIVNNNSLKDILIASVNYTGDVDTVAAIALGGASFSQEIEQNIPSSLYGGLECGTFGRNYLAQLDRKLLLQI